MVYLFDIKMAMLVFPIVALFMTFPILLWHYHRFGAISRWSILMLYSLVFYLICAYFLIILPLPSRAAVAKLTTPEMNLQPLMFVRQFLAYSPFQLTNPHTWLAALKAPTVIQPAFNVLLTVPFGFYLRTYFRRSWRFTLVAAFCLSLFFELTQLSGLYGIYPRPYRLFDVDDLLLNTTGGLLGFGLTRFVLPLLPSSDYLSKQLQVRAKQVSTFRHATAFVVDWLVFFLVSSLLMTIFHLHGNLWSGISTFVALGLVIVLPELRWQRTLGLKLVRLRIGTLRTESERPTAGQLLLRTGLGYSLIWLPAVSSIVISQVSKTGFAAEIIGIVLVLALGIIGLLLALDLLIDVFRPSHELLFEKLSRTVLRAE